MVQLRLGFFRDSVYQKLWRLNPLVLFHKLKVLSLLIWQHQVSVLIMIHFDDVFILFRGVCLVVAIRFINAKLVNVLAFLQIKLDVAVVRFVTGWLERQHRFFLMLRAAMNYRIVFFFRLRRMFPRASSLLFCLESL